MYRSFILSPQRATVEREKEREERCEMVTERCKSIDEISAMDGSKSHGGVRRSRATEVTSSGSGKRRRFDPRDDQESVVELEIQCRSGVDVNFTEDVVSSTESGSCDRVLSPKHELTLDLKAELRSETETSMSSNDGFSRETSSASETCLDSEEMESSSTLKNKPAVAPQAATSRRKPPTASIIPTAAEIEEFFSVAEKKDKERFANKYNYDIVNDVPMNGRYQWVRLKP